MPDKTLISFNGGTFSIDDLRSNLKSCPKICIKSTDLDAAAMTAAEHPPGTDDSRDLVALYQLHGKYFVLLGKSKVLAQTQPAAKAEQDENAQSEVNIQGHLVSKHLLKRLQTIAQAPSVQIDVVQDVPMMAQSRYGDRGERAPFRGRNDSFGNRGAPRRW